ncbi:hypothetical protein [Prosthecobacter sp.]|uniref:hypothetical protein n=1 Tax=Prosthecobacter sp. TaxID=1965333 RepID=UPI0037849DBC
MSFPFRFDLRVKMVALILLSLTRLGAEPAEPLHKAEVKLIVPGELAGPAREKFEAAGGEPELETVCFFDTADQKLQAAGIILRARKKGDNAGDAIVKLTYKTAEAAAADVIDDVKVEEDWVDQVQPRLSRTIDRGKPLSDDQAAALKTGALSARDALDEAQRALVEKRVKGLKWEDVKCYGPIAARIWKDVKFPGAITKKMTVEDWSMAKDGAAEEKILEVSAKGKKLTAKELAAFVKDFFSTAKTQKLGEPSGESKTKRALQFFAPGK